MEEIALASLCAEQVQQLGVSSHAFACMQVSGKTQEHDPYTVVDD